MEKRQNNFLRDVPTWLRIAIGLICVLIVISAIMAIQRGSESPKVQQQSEVHVYVNSNDSTIIRLQQDVKELRQYIKDLNEDSIEVVVRRVKKCSI